jgi:fructan beta-fructosidase
MNDINGLWHWDGVYYMTYQTTPTSADFNINECSIGFATSRDMLRWEQQQVLLRPNRHGVPGSGSTVVDVDNTSGLKNSENPVFVSLYSGTTSGVCVIYSNDLGRNWEDYSGNPVISSPEFDPRDPHVFWHGQTHRWVMAIYGPGIGNTSLYVSADLKTWNHTSTVRGLGNECPDLFELNVDGDPSRAKWVLMKADGQYRIGDFDGTAFIADSDEIHDSTVGPHFYAAQTFFRDTFLDGRLIQIGWMGTWSGSLDSSPWNQNATFPVELKLIARVDGIRLVRNPIREIESLHRSSIEWSAQKIVRGQDILSGIDSKSYVLIAEFDLARTDANRITFLLAGKTVCYDLSDRTLMGKTLLPVENRLEIRILVDWSQLEVFGNDGDYSWTERVPFRPDEDSLSLLVDGDVELVSMVFHDLKSTWD